MIVAVSAMVVSCGDSSIPVYNEQYNAVRFAGVIPDPDSGNNESGITYYNFSFVEEPGAETHLFEIPVYVTGKGMPEDTKVGYEIDTDNTNAPDGSYEILSASIPQGECKGSIVVRLIKTPELEGEVTYTLALRLVASDELMLGDSRYVNSRMTWSNNLPFPNHNNLVRSYNMLIAGMPVATSTSKNAMSTNGLMAIVGALGWDDWDDPDAHPGLRVNNSETYGYYKYLPQYSMIYLNSVYIVYSRQVGEWLENYEKEHGAPLLHNGGVLEGQPVRARYY